MELEKTTVLSALVWVAGVLAEVVFHESLSNSVLGLVLSIIVAAIVIAATYFIIDGVNSVLIKQRTGSMSIRSVCFVCLMISLKSRLI